MIDIAEIRELYGANTLVLSAGFLLGIAFGFIVERSGFCLRSAILQMIKPGKSKPVQTVQFLVAILVALVLTQASAAYFSIDLGQSIYISSPIRLVALIAGGALFGVGMILTRGCISRVLVLSATGNLRSWLTIIFIGIGAYATLRGILAYPRIWLEGLSELGSSTKTIPALLQIDSWLAVCVISLLFLGFIASLVRKTGIYPIIPGVLVGAIVAAGWLITGVLGFDEFEPTQLGSVTFTMPVGDTLQYLMTYTGDKLRFGITIVLGVLLGSFVSALFARRLKIQGFQTEYTPLRYALGAMLMSFGGVTSLGCTIGQGLTGLSTLSISSIIALTSCIAGAAIASHFISDDIIVNKQE